MYEKYQTMSFDLSDSGILTITFQREQSLNSMDKDFHRELSTVFADVSSDRRTQAVVLTGAGRAFSAGGDLDWINDSVQEDPDTTFFEAKKIVNDILDVPQPMIAAVNGAAAGFGLTMALLCDFSIVAENAPLSDPHVRLGLVAGDGGAFTWPILVGMARAKRYLLTGDSLSGGTAAEWGLVTEACAQDQVLPRAQEIADQMVRAPEAAIRGTKKALNSVYRTLALTALDIGLEAERVSLKSEDHHELVRRALDERTMRRKGKVR